ncbi:MAG: UV DNA damage repair endonuclease UvsE [Syntrophomonadaceae bacterium]|jgi:UV DNA damage endonuclease|nr:UV DNA damage repair endonuclease UvsE [Syntrophomonadaceae bacterium]
MSIGYACLTVGVPNTDMKNCLLKNADEEKLTQLIEHNLSALQHIINYNVANEILLFRISSDIIPFGSSPVNTLPWKNLFQQELQIIGESVKRAGIRVSMHPGQYTVLNSPDQGVAKRAVDDLMYHSDFLDSLGVDGTSKIILHIGGAYGDKKVAIKRFAQRYKDLDECIQRRLVIENDDKTYHIGDVLELGFSLGVPVVYDNLHNQINYCDQRKDDFYWISQCRSSWKPRDGKQKVHYSQQNPLKSAGSHSESIAIDEFLDFYLRLGESQPDIMLEVKDKNLSALKCINCTTQKRNIKVLELEWSKYKYAILEKSPKDYKNIRELLKDKSTYPAVDFYRTIDHAYGQGLFQGNIVNAALHIWGYFKNLANNEERKRFFSLLQRYQENDGAIAPVKRFLFRLAEKYKQEYLLMSYYFL